MKKSRFSEQQIAFVLRQAEEGTPIAEVCRKAGISEASFYAWRKKYGGLLPSEMKRLKLHVTSIESYAGDAAAFGQQLLLSSEIRRDRVRRTKALMIEISALDRANPSSLVVSHAYITHP